MEDFFLADGSRVCVSAPPPGDVDDHGETIELVGVVADSIALTRSLTLLVLPAFNTCADVAGVVGAGKRGETINGFKRARFVVAGVTDGV